jgi:hypothetical protein
MVVAFQNKRKPDLTAKETSQFWQQSLYFWEVLFEIWDQSPWVIHTWQGYLWISCQVMPLRLASLIYFFQNKAYRSQIITRQGCQLLEVDKIPMSNLDQAGQRFRWQMSLFLSTGTVIGKGQYSWQIRSIALCQLEAATPKEKFWNIVPQGEFE